MNPGDADIRDEMDVGADGLRGHQRFARDRQIAGAGRDDRDVADGRLRCSRGKPEGADDAILLRGRELGGKMGGLLIADVRRQAMLFRVDSAFARRLRSTRTSCPGKR